MQLVDDDARRAHQARTRPAALEATFLDTASSWTDELRVSIPGFDTGRAWWPATGWQPRVDDAGGPIYPAAGDEAVVVISNQRRAWVLGWRPAT